MSWNERLFVIIPLLSVMCNVFLLLTVASVKKDKLIDAFIGLLLTFTAWSIGSLFLRMKLFPGPEFWYMISITGIFLPWTMLCLLSWAIMSAGTGTAIPGDWQARPSRWEPDACAWRTPLTPWFPAAAIKRR